MSKTRSKRLARNSKGTGAFREKEQTVLKQQTCEIENKEQFGKELKISGEEANRSKETARKNVENTEEFVLKEQTVREELENFRRRSKPLQRD